jgi:hypothetical protein
MPNDYRYDLGDRVFDGLNYETTPGVGDAVAREMQSWPVEIDGEPYGNRAHPELRRAPDTTETREKLKRYYEEVGNRYVAAGGIQDLTVTVDDATGITGVAVVVEFFDTQRNRTVRTALPFVELA